MIKLCQRFISFILLLTTLASFSIHATDSPTNLKDQPRDNTIQMNNTVISILNKSLTDKNNYHLITLDNNLKVLLVSDPQAERFSASLSVNVGSFQDPKNQQGLAHFLEHMLFLGTQKYPESGDYQNYINTHGGSNNAYTTTNTTNFYFDINPIAYEGALDRFSQFFISPLLSESLTQREKNAVDSEYKAKLKDESRRSNEAFKTLINPKHPFSHFSVGNLDTLKDRPNNPLREQLLKLYKENYFSENMALVMVADLPYNQMATLAQEYFSAIPSKPKKEERHYPKLIKQKQPQLQFLKPLIDSNTINFYYQINAQSQNYKTQPSRYLSYILGNENKGSLYATLKSEGLINGLTVKTSNDYGDNALFTVKIRLTNEGMKKIDKVAKQFFATISLLKSSPINPLYLEEGLKLSQLMFNNQNYVDPQSLARTLSAKMLYIPTKDILSCFRLDSAASPKQVQNLLQQLTPENLLVQVISNQPLPEKWAKQKDSWKIEPWYKSEYQNSYFSSNFINLIKLSIKDTRVGLPERNSFIPEHLNLINEKDKTPSIVFQQEGFSFWNKSDSSFGKPIAINFLAIRFDHAADTPKHTLLNQLWSRLFNESISESTYAPYVAGLGYSFYPHANGATLRTSGYSDKQSTYMTWLVDKLFLFTPNLNNFKQAKTQLEKDLSNQKSRQAYSLANSALNTLITKNSFTTEQLEGALKELSIKDLKSYIKAARDQFDIVGYSTGNQNKKQTQQLAASLYQRFVGRLKPRKPVEIETKQISSPQKYHYRFDSTSDDTTVLYTLIDTSHQKQKSLKTNTSITEKAYFSIFKKLISSAFYHELRTNKQLGYIVGAQDLSIRNTPILGLLVQSPNKNNLTIINAIADFLNEQKDRLQTLPLKEFEEGKNSLLTQLKMTAKNLSDNALNEWHQIAKQDPNFNLQEEWIDRVEKIKRQDFITFIKSKVQSTHTTKIIIHNKEFPNELTKQGWVETSPNNPRL
ncbi:peptidase M16 [Marinomonas sp. CT5]|nr:peptidase M16 [Marinomonas sp. CT5]